MLAYGVPAFRHQPSPAELQRYGCSRVSIRCTRTRQRVRRAVKKCLRRAVRIELRQLTLYSHD